MRSWGLSVQEQEDLWQRWRQGESLRLIARRLGKRGPSVRAFVLQTGGIQQRPPQRAARSLTVAEREEISRGVAVGDSCRAIARRLGRAPSTVSRELARNGGRHRYRAQRADAAADRRAARPKPCKLAVEPRLRRGGGGQAGIVLVTGADRGLAAGGLPRRPDHARLSRDHLPEPVCPAPSCAAPRPAGLSAHRPSHASPAGQAPAPGPRPAHQHHPDPPAARRGEQPIGHWEGDLVLGMRPSAVLTLVERTSRSVLLVALPHGWRANQVRPALVAAMERLPRRLCRSLTWDQGKEMAEHARFTADTGVPVFFCDPRSPWQRASNENANGLVRQIPAQDGGSAPVQPGRPGPHRR